MATITWTGTAGDGNFNNPANWSPAQVPTAADTVIITPAALSTIAVANDAVGTLTTGSKVTLSLQNNTSFTIGNGVNTSFTNGGTFALNGVGNNTDLILGAPKVTFTGGGVVLLGGNPNDRIYGAAATDVLNNVNNTIEGGGQLGAGQLSLTNATGGKIIANSATALVLNTGTGTVTNAGLMEATSTGGLVLQSSVANGTTGKITAAGGNVYLQNATLSGGTLASSGGAAIVVQGGVTGTLDGTTNGVTNTGALDVNNNGTLSVIGSLINSGTIALQSVGNYTDFIAGSTGATLTGSGTLALSDTFQNRIYGAVAADVLDNVNNTITGAGQLGAGQLTLINGAAGIIDASATNNRLVLSTGSTTLNSGLLEATGSAGLQISSAVDNTSGGTILANGATANVFLDNGSDVIGGKLVSLNGGVIQVEGGNRTIFDGSTQAVTNKSTFDITNNASVTLLGTLANDATIALQSGGNYTDFIVGSASATLTGGGTITLSDNSVNRIYGTAGTNVLDNLNNTITGGGQFGTGQLTLINGSAGVIDASATNNALILDTQGNNVVNTGLIEATGAAGLVIVNTTVDSSTGGTVLADAANVYLEFATLAGGTLNATGGAAIVVVSGDGATLDGSSQTVTSLGSIQVQNNGSLTLLGTISNQNTISLGSIGNYTRLIIGPTGTTPGTVTLTGGGVISLSDNIYNVIYGNIPGDTLVNLNDTITGAGQIGANSTTSLINDATINASGGNNALVLQTNGGAVTNNALMESTNTGGLVINSTTVTNNGTMLAAGGNIYLQSGDIIGGLLESSGGGALVVQGGQAGTLDGSAANITNDGAIDINNNGSLTILGNFVNNGSIALQSGGNYTRLIAASPTVTLTGGGSITLSDNSTNLIYGLAATDVIDNVNNVISGAGQLGDGQLTLINEAAGIIDANAGNNSLILDTSGEVMINKGLMEATNTGGLFILNTTVSNSGTILAAGGNVYLQSSTIEGGTLNSSGTGAFVLVSGQAATLDGSAAAVKTLGTLDITNNASLTVLGSIVNSGTINLQSVGNYTRFILGSGTVTLTGGGALTLSDNGNNLVYGGVTSDVLDNVNNTISGAGQFGDGQMTLINSGTIEATGNNALIVNLGSTGNNTATGKMLGIGAGGLIFQNGTYTNSGLIEAQDGSNVTFQAGAILTNSVNGTLTGGTYEAIANGHGATVNLGGTAIITDNADLILSGAGAAITSGGVALGSSLTKISTHGTLQVLNGATYSSTKSLNDQGSIVLSGGTLSAVKVTVQAGASLSGFGTVKKLTDLGTVTATGLLNVLGTTSIAGLVSGTGTLQLNGGATTLSTGETLTVSTIAMINAATLALDTAVSFGGTFNIKGATTISNGGGGSFTNTGLFEETATGTAAISAAFTNSGTLSTAIGGTLAFTGGLTNTGTILDNGGLTDTAALTGGVLQIGASGSASIGSLAGTGASTLSTLTMAGGTLNTNGTTLNITGDYNNTAAGTGNAYNPFAGVTGTIDGVGTKLLVYGVNGTVITMVNGVPTITIAAGGTASFVIVNDGPTGDALLRGALQTSVNGGNITSTALSGSGVTAGNFGAIAGGNGHTGVYTIAYSSGTLTGQAIHVASDFANVAGVTIDIVAAAATAATQSGALSNLSSPPMPDLIPYHPSF